MTKTHFEQLSDLNVDFFESAKKSLLDPLGLYLANDVKWIKLNENWNSLEFPVVVGGKAFKHQVADNYSWRNTIEACGLTAGLVGGIGGEKCRTAAAHAIHNAITQIITPNEFLHGEIVGVGLLLQLRLEEMKNNNKLADQSIKQLLILMKQLDLPTTISELGINVFENKNLEKIADFTCRNKSEIHFLPFEISKRDIIEVISNFEQQKIKI